LTDSGPPAYSPWLHDTIGPQTRVEELPGRLMRPGLVDAHLHRLDIVDLEVIH
jgi:cytosine/adenosine deaminase-related metal-dependent hydrolase